MNKKPTIRDVAKYAKVSPATVSYVLNGVNKVSEDTKTRVLEAIETLNYYPDFTAVSLSKKKSNIIGIMLPITEDSPAVFKNNLYYNEFVSGVEMVARNHKFDTMITGVSSPEEARLWVKKRNLDGVIFLGKFPQNLFAEMTKLDIPIVLIDTYEEYTSFFQNVKIDDEYGGYLAGKHLIELGHKNIAFVSTSLELSPVDSKRFTGFKKALQQAGVKLKSEFIYEALDISFEKGIQLGEQILTESKPITGIVVVSDILAIGMIKAFQENKKLVPEHYSVVGFDDLSISKYMTPSLTTVRQDIFQKGKSAAELLIHSFEAPDAEQHTIELPVQLVVRGSTRRI
ncbi:LacI family DNA-binding transcriptional regulator [Robertmurraya sp. DFI.2.37]|jgi:LacI family transcriptional regulator|uniref:LacI family DNA-binding transcriptional regulator n=1 Tax=Robertmurraya sp. DFI.2.37 TaxID=3031819 RepID=UPI000BA79077|nr:LacI family DNA-binding transcriptional regulator [Robertmurraya sp. DFI.2.37]MDF1507961.1 LacI family DNA-binding transcriptional regulator [Robertmurraya sp. DFI.2.37]PAE21112.1 LacI family transcriptional regulator [Bacillus sp. 7504-2]